MNVYSKFTDMFKHYIKGTYIRRSIFLLLTLMTLVATNALAQSPKVEDGIYYIRNNATNQGYLWPSVTTNNTTGYRYLTTSLDISAPEVINNNKVSYPAHDKSYSHWVVKNVEGGYVQLINPRLNKYVVIREFPKANNSKQNDYVDRDVWLTDEPDAENLDWSYFVLNDASNPYYKISPKPGLNSKSPTTNYSLNSASGDDRVWLTWSKSDNKPYTGEGREGLIQFYASGTPQWSFTSDLLDAPTISDVDENSQVTITEENGLESGYNIRYTTDGSAPTASSDILEGSTMTIRSSNTLKVVIERYGVVLTDVATKAVVPVAPKPTFTLDADGSITMTSETGTSIYYTTDGTVPTTSSIAYSTTPIDADVVATATGSAIKAIAVDNEDNTIVSFVVTIPLATYTYKIVKANHEAGIAISLSIKQAVGKQLRNGSEKTGGVTNGYNDIPEEIRSPYLSDETINFYTMEGDFDADNLDDEHKITATPANNANIYVTYTTTKLEEKFVKLSGSSPFNISQSSNYLYDTGSAIGTDSEYDGDKMVTKPYLWYFLGNDPYNLQIRNSSSNKYMTTSSSVPTRSDDAVSYILTGKTTVDATHEEITLKNLANSETITMTVNSVVLPISYTLIDLSGQAIEENIDYVSAEGFGLPAAWKTPLVDYHYWNADAFVDSNEDGKPDKPYVLKDSPVPTEITSATQVAADNVIYVTYTLKSDNTIDLDGRDLLDNRGGAAGKTYRLQFTGGQSFNQEDGLDGVSESPTKAIYPYSNGDASLYVYGEAQWNTQLASGASTRTRWLWYLEPAKDVLDPYHVRVSSYQNQTNYTDPDTKKVVTNFHSYLRTYKPDGYSEVVTGVTNNNPVAQGKTASATAETDLPAGSEYMLLGTSTESLRLVTVDKIDGSRRTVNSFEQYWKNNPTVQGKLTTKVTQVGRDVTLTDDQKTEIGGWGWHVYKEFANSAPWVHNNDGGGGTAHTTSKKFLNEEHVYQTVSMGESFQLVPTDVEPMLILLDQHGWEIARVRLPSGPDDPKRAERYAAIHKYSSPMVKAYHYYKTASKIPGYHKYKVDMDSHATVKNDPTKEYTSDALGVLVGDEGNLPDYGTQALEAGKERDWYVTYDVKDDYASAYAEKAEYDVNSASLYLVKQGGKYAKNNGDALEGGTVDYENIDNNFQWYLRPNFNIDREMGYLYSTDTGHQEDAKTKEETEQDYVDGVVPGWTNGFDPYNMQIQSYSNPLRYFTTNANGASISSSWTGTYPSGTATVSLQNMSDRVSAVGLDQVNMKITNATFMVLDDGNGNMRLVPRFDNAKVMQRFTSLAEPEAAAEAGDQGVGDQTLYLEPIPTVVHNSSQITAMGGRYILADDFTASGSIGTKTAPFTGIIEGNIDYSFDVSAAPFIAYAKDAVIKNVIVESADISSGNADGHAGAIVATASGETRIYNCGVNGGSVGGSEHVGGIVGHLEGYARVINCYSYATITGGTDVGGIVGYNSYESKANDIHTMVMNCMFYGDITGGTPVSPVYGGLNINNLNSGGLNTFNYYAYDELKSSSISKYNCALAIEEKNLKRFEFYRLLLNSNKKLAAYYASTSTKPVQPEDMAKWVLETADRSIDSPKEYPVLKSQGYYPSIINYDVEHAPDSASVGRNHGGKLGKTLSVTISGVGSNAPSGANITTGSLTLQRTDKDFDRFNFNYDKVQLPYYNDVGTGNYTNNKVVTGWKITAITAVDGDPYTSANYPTTGVTDYPNHNYADRRSSNKDLYSVSKRVFSQGAYFDVPYGVTSITIEPYWGNAAYVADEYLDVVYNTGYGAQSVKELGRQFGPNKTSVKINGSDQIVYTSISEALKDTHLSGATVYDNAVVLVGNLHQGDVPSNGSKAFTIMSVDLNNDNEPDYSMIYHHNNRQQVCPIRFDFLNIPGTAQAQKPNGADNLKNFTIFLMKGWFETTNTCIVYSNQVEYENKQNNTTKVDAPLILLGGDFEQFVSTRAETVDGKTYYIHVGGNVKIDNFGLGTHSDGNKSTPHVPVSVTGGEFKGFYLTGTYNPNAIEREDNAECYISGGHFVEAAGACQEPIKGDVHWQIYNADIDAFYGGGINDARPIKGSITTDIYNSHVTLFCGGPKFGNMTSGKAVTTNAERCVFDEYFGAGYGGLSYSRQKYIDESGFKFGSNPYTTDKEKYFDGKTTNANNSHADYGKKGPGVAIDFDYEFFVWSTGVTGARMYVKFASFSLAQCDNVFSNLKGCTVNQNFYGGGSLGKVVGKATSVLDGCTVHGNVFGGGYSGTLPTLEVRDGGFTKIPVFNSNSGIFEPGEFSGTTTYTWKNADEAGITLTNGGDGSDKTNHYIYTNQNLTVLGQVGETDLTVKGNTSVAGNVFGGGDESAISASATATGNTKVTIEKNDNNETPTISYVYGGGNTADVDGSTEVDMTNGTVSQDIYGGGKGQTTVVGGNVEVNIGPKGNAEKPLSVHNVYGGSAFGAVNTTQNTETGKYDNTTTVNINGGTVTGSVFGGGLGQEAAEAVAESGTPGDPGYIAPQEAKPAIVAKNFGATTVNMEGGQVKTAVYGGSNVNGVLQQDATVTLIGGTVGDSENQNRDVVFGGGKGAPTLVNGNVTVNIGREKTGEEPEHVGTATIYGHVYGGGELGNVNASKPESELVFDPTKETLVNLLKGTVNGYAYGGGLGSAEKAAYVGGDVIVTLDGAKVQQVFGANNINGTPKGHVLVHVKRTVNSEKDGSKTREQRTTYDVEAVYGGGNMADYVPTDACLDPAVEGNPAKIAAARAEVIIEGCELTSIDKVYGGGNAAAVPATDVTIKGTYIINTLYGGGNGAGEGNLGANVGYRSYSSLTPTEEEKTAKQYGTGKAETKLLGGYINDVYGGSNTRGDVREGTDVRTRGKDEVVTDCCEELNVGNVYGAGSHADVEGDVNIVLECMPRDFVDAVYGGAEEATVDGNVTLTVTSGKFGRVFGGNNKGGNIRGSITVNVYEDGCKPLIIGELYGGGNAAPYSVFGCTKSGETWTANESGTTYYGTDTQDSRDNIKVNVIACTSAGKVFGGGMGSTAKVIGNTHVYINMLKGIVDGEIQDNIGKLGQVFGGGNNGVVKGNTLIDIGTDTEYTDPVTGEVPDGQKKGINITKGTYTSPSDGTYLSPTRDEYIDMPSAGVYGGGNEADVEGNATLNIGTEKQTLGITIDGDIFGGGYGAATHVTGDVVVNIGKRTNTAPEGDPVYAYEGYANITGDVYGGSAKGKVNSHLEESVETATEGKTTHVNFYGGSITGNIYGGGLGEDNVGTENDHAADVYGPVTVTLKKGSSTNTTVNNVFGCNNVLGTPKNTVTVDINGGTVNNNVYGGGNQAAYTPAESTSNYPAVNIINGTVHENVFGGGLGLTAVVTANPHITIGDNVEGHVVAIKKSVYGGGELAGVTGNTDIVLNSGTIGTEGEGGAVYGNIYGGGFGNTESTTAGLVSGNTNMTIKGGAVLHNIYGGGAYGSVGSYTYNSDTHETTCAEGTGTANITVTGGTIGTNGHENGMVFGASRGDVAAPDGVHDRLAWVNNTNVIIGTAGQGTDAPQPQIKGSVYGGGENGHTYHDTHVTINSGRIGITDINIDGGAAYAFRGNVYGGGCGTDKYDSGSGDKYNPLSGIVNGETHVVINGGHVVRNLYGAGAMGSAVTGTNVTINGGTIGAEGSGGGYVYAAARGDEALTDANQAYVGNTSLTIAGGTIWQSAFGGGQSGIVKGNVAVAVSGGVVKNDVYGGGALANTNTDNWNAATDNWSDTSTDTYYEVVKHLKTGESSVDGYYTRSGESEPYTYTPAAGLAVADTKYYKKLDAFLNVAANGTAKKTTVSLTGGTIGNAYGGGLGRLAQAAVPASGEPGSPEYVPAKEAVPAVEAMVYGDISVTVNGTKFTQETARVDGKAIPVTGRVFGCNNLNGTPKGSVLVHVMSTHRLDDGEHVKNQFEIQGVYGGGNMSHYEPKTYDNTTEFGQHTKVIIDGCHETSIERVYGGGNASDVPFTDVTIEGCFQIGYVFGGGNGGDKINKGTGAGWESNPGANVDGYTNVVLHGGTIGEAFGGSDSRGLVGGSELTQDAKPGCPLVINNIYGASKEAETDNDVILNLAGCENSVVDKVFGGSYNADVRGNITINVYNGIYTSIYGGNDRQGTVGGNITINVEEVDECMPIIIQNLVGGGSQADYPGVDSNGNPAKAYKGAPYERGIHDHPDSYVDFTSGNITINVKAATRIDRIFGGCDNARATGTTTVNINMVKGSKAGDEYTLPAGYTGNAIPNLVEGRIKDEIGTIGDVYGGGNEGDVVGNSTVNIGTEQDIAFTNPTGAHSPAHLTPNDAGKYDVFGAHIDADVFGGGNKGNVTGDATVNICTADYSGTTGFEGVSIGKSVYGGGRAADVQGNTSVTMSGGNRTEVDGAYVFDGVYGGGLMGSVGTAADGEGNVVYHTGAEAHAGCIGKIVNYKANTGKCTVVISGGQVGPAETALADGGMENTGRYFIKAGDDTAPVDYGFVFGAGRGEVEDPATDKDADFRSFVKETDVTIGGTAFIMASVYGGGENGRVANDTHVTIEGDCQIGCGEGEVEDGKPVRYTTPQWTGEVATNFAECASWPYEDPYVPYDPYAAPGDEEDAKKGSDGHTYYGNVFGGGSGYFPYKKADGSHEWLRSAGQVYGNTKIDITGGHILTCVYGGNEMTDVGTYTRVDGNIVHAEGTGKCTINMVGGTLGVPRIDGDATKHPVTCYLFGAGKGDQRTHFNTWTNVQETEVNVSGTARIFGSVFGGGEDGHVLGNAKVNIGGNIDLNGDGDKTDEGEIFPAPSGLKIGTTGTSYVDGNVFGGGRGFSGLALTAGSTGGNTEVNITDGTMLGSIYGGGRLASVGIDFTPADDPSYGQLVDDKEGNPVTHGHITVNISGGTIGNDVVGAQYGGNVFGAGMGRNTKLNGDFNDLWPKIATSKTTTVNISGGTIKKNVYGGAEYGIVRNQAEVTISGSADIRGSVYGGGKGSDDYQHKTTIEVGGYANLYYSFTPMLWNGAVSGNTIVNVEGGTIGQNVYGGGELASVGLIDFVSDKDGNFTNMPKHESLTDGFGLSWPYEFTYHAAAPNDDAVGGKTIGGKTTVNITGGHIGSTTWDDGTGYVFGGSKGKVEFGITSISDHRYTEAFCANVKETEVNIDFATPSGKNSENIGAEANCIMGAVYGGGEDGHVYDNAEVNITGGLIGLSVYGAGKGISTYKGYLRDDSTSDPDDYKSTTDDLYSWTAGKVYGNTKVTMANGHVLNNIYGGGYLGSVGKGNYAGGADDYFPAGYGETLTGNLWDNVSDNSKAFLSSGKATVEIEGGTVGTQNGTYGTVGGDPSKASPTGMVFGGSRGQAAQDIMFDPRYEYAPNFYLGYVNETEVTIGTESGGPRIFSQVFGGGRDGHVRSSARVIINNGTIGQTYAESDLAANPDYQRYHRGNVYGSGSGLGLWNSVNHGMSSGSVTRSTRVDINGGTIYNNVYGGGALSSVGPPKLDPDPKKDYADSTWSKCLVNINGGTIGRTADYESHQYGGCVYGASRGNDFATGESPENYATVLWTKVNINGGNIAGNVYGGAKGGIVWKDTEVNMKGGTIAHDAYGGGQGTTDIAANIGGNTTVKLNEGKGAGDSGCMVEKVFGCNDLNGTPKGHVLVHVYATQHKGTAKIVPAGGKYAKFESMEGGYSITNYSGLTTLAAATGTDVTAYTAVLSGGGTEDEKKTALANMIEAIADEKYDVLAVYGGGDLAMYEPTDPNENTDVIIDGCALTSIKQVYGGGNAASTPANLVRINEAYEIHEAFGGGNGKDDYETGGKWYKNLGANVGYKATFHSDKSGDPTTGTKANPYPAVANDDADTPEERRANTSYHYGKGTVELNVTGGYVHTTYGGSNMKGNVRKSAVTNTEDAGVCTLQIDASYPAGKNADTDGEAKINGSCVDYQEAIYGGSENANVYSDVVIDITNGHYGAIYGGNNTRGKIYGSITINVHEEGCKPIIIDNLYGGGYNADYSIYGYNDDGSARTKTQYDALDASEKAKITVQRDPQINIISATKIGKIYGGGYNAKVIGSPSVNVNMEEGFVTAKYVTKDPGDFSVGNHTVEDHGVDCSYYVERLEDGKAILRRGTVGTVYGGGYKGDVQGNTDVEIGTGEWLSFTGKRETTDADGKVYTYNSETGKWDWTKTEGETTTSGTVDDKPAPARNAATITGNIFGGGEGEALESGTDAFFCKSAMVGVDDDNYPDGATSVIIANGTVGTLEGEEGSQTLKAGTGNVYGGGEIGRVQKSAAVTIGMTPKEGETMDNTKFKPSVYGSVFGGGQGVDTHGFSGLVQGNSTVTIQGFAKVGESVYGGGEFASVGRYNLVDGRPTTSASETSGNCIVTVRDDAEIGPNNMTMFHVDNEGNIVADDQPDNSGHVLVPARVLCLKLIIEKRSK